MPGSVRPRQGDSSGERPNDSSFSTRLGLPRSSEPSARYFIRHGKPPDDCTSRCSPFSSANLRGFVLGLAFLIAASVNAMAATPRSPSPLGGILPAAVPTTPSLPRSGRRPAKVVGQARALIGDVYWISGVFSIIRGYRRTDKWCPGPESNQ